MRNFQYIMYQMITIATGRKWNTVVFVVATAITGMETVEVLFLSAGGVQAVLTWLAAQGALTLGDFALIIAALRAIVCLHVAR